MNRQRATSILVIEDDADFRQTLAAMLELNGFKVFSASNGTDGLNTAKRETPSLIITDVAMPGMTGFELLAAFRADISLRSIPVIVISARVDRATTRRGMELGAADFITKPFTEREIINSIATCMEKKELLDELDSFAHTVAHDLRGPLTTLNGRIELAELMLGEADEATLRLHFAAAADSARRLGSIIDSLLVLAGVRRETVVPSPLDMAVIVAEAIDRLSGLIHQKCAHIEKPDSWPAAIGHAPWVIEVWVNYISNAVSYGGPSPQITLTAENRPEKRCARFWVEDNGPGLDEAAQEKLFVPFASISTARTSGHGLGLSIVRRIVEKLGGQVGVVSSPGAGARFWFELPANSSTGTGSLGAAA